MANNSSLDELSLDLSDEMQTFKEHLECLGEANCSSSGPRVSSLNFKAAKQFTDWVQVCLNKPHLEYRSHFRQALILASAHSSEFETLDCGRPSDNCFHVLFAKQELVSAAARRAVTAGCTSLEDWWERFDDTVAMLEVMVLLAYPDVELKNSVRCFAARCRQLDGDSVDLLSHLQQYGDGKLSDGDLRRLQREFSSHGISSVDLIPLIQLCDPNISWHELCAVSQRICRQVLMRRSASRNQLANTMRRWVANPFLQRSENFERLCIVR